MLARLGRASRLLLVLTLALPLFSACSTQQVRASPSLAVFNTSTYSPDGKTIAAGRNMFNAVYLYDGSAARFQRALLGKIDEPFSIAAHSLSISSDSRFLAAAGIDNRLVAWDLANDQMLVNLTDIKDASALTFSSTGRTLAVAGSDNSVTLLELPSGERIARLDGHLAPVFAIAFSSDGKLLATGGADHSVRVWDIATLQQLQVLEGYGHPVHSLSFSPDGMMLATYSGDTIKLWQRQEKNTHQVTLPRAGQSSNLVSLVLFLANAVSIESGSSPVMPGNIFKGEAASMATLKRLPVLFSPSGNILAALRFNRSLSGDYEVLLLNMSDKTSKTISCQCFSISFSPDGAKLAAVGAFGVKLIDTATGSWVQSVD